VGPPGHPGGGGTSFAPQRRTHLNYASLRLKMIDVAGGWEDT
jgi:hypothetical protein